MVDLKHAARALTSAPVHVSNALPLYPDHREDARRMVRHRLAQWVEDTREKVGPRPGEATHALAAHDGTRGGTPVLFVSREMYDQLRADRSR